MIGALAGRSTLVKVAVVGSGGLLGVIALVVAGLAAYVSVNADRTYDVAAPVVRASTDPAVIARGEYLVHAVAHCSDCHADVTDKRELRGRPAMSGGKPITPPSTPRRASGSTATRTWRASSDTACTATAPWPRS
jgi:mono/diheme cytochrome c family protein